MDDTGFAPTGALAERSKALESGGGEIRALLGHFLT
jgi:hypothetical protein